MKKFKEDFSPKKALALWSAELEGYKKAKEIVKAFNEAIRGKISKKVRVNIPIIARGEDIEEEVPKNEIRNGELCTIEPYLKGKWLKFSSNTGWVRDDQKSILALSHFSYHFSGGKLVLTDLQV